VPASSPPTVSDRSSHFSRHGTNRKRTVRTATS
jgi:hypothetical protein